MELSTESDACETTLLDAFDQEWIKLPLAAMRECGPASQTLGGLLSISNRETFVKQCDIARAARLPIATIRKHLAKLHKGGWIIRKGREAMASGRLRRTATVRITSKSQQAAEEFAVLPWWFCGSIMVGGLKGDRYVASWAERALFAFLASRLLRAKVGIERECDEFSVAMFLEEFEWRFNLSLTSMQTATGLSRNSIITAKEKLARINLIDWRSDEPADLVCPRLDTVVETKEMGNGKCMIGIRLRRSDEHDWLG